jgi:FkbM family methyltransferase
LLHAALWSSDTPIAPAVSTRAWQQAAFRVRPAAGGEQSPIAGLTMSSLLREAGRQQIDLVKIDIEGAESELFRGQVAWLESVRALAIEFHGHSREEIGFDQLVQHAGFEIVADTSHTVFALKARLG